MVNVKVSLLTVALTLIAGARAQCANNAVGIGYEQLCNLCGVETWCCGEIEAFITTPGSWNQAAGMTDIEGASEQYLCGEYQGSPGFGPAHVDCDGSGHITGAVPPNAGHYHCYDETHVIGEGVGGIAAILSCCQPD